MGTHNICFHGEIRKILCRYPLSVAMSHPDPYKYVLLGTVIAVYCEKQNVFKKKMLQSTSLMLPAT